MFRDFSNFEIEDFAFDESFQKWVMGHQSDHNDFWQRYMEEHPHQVDTILAARELVLQLSNDKVKQPDEQLEQTIWTVVGQHINTRRHRLWRRLHWMHSAAASIFLLAGAGLFFWLDQPEASTDTKTVTTQEVADKARLFEKINRQHETLSFTLADGSTVRLEKNSRLRYPEHFDTRERVVHLEGEAFFDIAKDPKHPFIIFANKTAVKVLGTSFRIRAHEKSDKVIVSVKSGKVSVFERKDFEKIKESSQMSGLVLMANQQAEFSNELEKFSKMIVPEPALLDHASKKEFDFDQTPLPEVFETLQKSYGIEIIYDRDLVASRILKVSLEDESLTEKLDIICQTMGLTYHIVDARIIIETQ